MKSFAAQHLPCLGTVFVLAFARSGRRPPGRWAGASGGRHLGLVDVLAALAAGAIGVDAQVFKLEIDMDGLVNFRRHIHRRERSVAALGRVERRDAHKPMHAARQTATR